MVTLAAAARAASDSATEDVHRLAASSDAGAAAGTRVNTARLLSASLRDLAAEIARRADLPPPSKALTMPLAVLWSRSLKFDAADAAWPDRDRFVLSAGSATPLLYALLHLSGHPGMDQTTLAHCGELDAVAARTATFGRHPAIEATAAPGGQTIGLAVGMALAERALAVRFGKSLVDHRVWAVADAAELTQGVTQEAAALAGQLRLDRLVLLADAGAPEADDARARFVSLGWAVKSAASDRPEDIESALSFAHRSRKPTLLWCAPSPEVWHRASRATPNALEAWRRVGSRGSVARRAWLKRIARHPQRNEFERVQAGRLPEALHDTLAAVRQQLRVAPQPHAPAAIALEVVDRLIANVPELLFGHAGHTQGIAKSATAPASPCAARIIGCQNRPQAMAACATGLALHGGAIPMMSTELLGVMDQLPALRLAAMHRRRSVHLAFDPGLEGLGASWQPTEVLAWLRAIPNLQVFRPGCAIEALECFELALRRTDGPSLLVLSRTVTPKLRGDQGENRCARGGYVLAEADGGRHATLIASGPGLATALQARAYLAADAIAVAVVSLPCWGLFAAQDDAFRRSVLGTAPRFGLEAACRAGWDRWLNESGTFIGCGDPNADGPGDALRHRYGLTPELIAQTVRRKLAQS